MSENNPFARIARAKAETAVRKSEASENPGSLNPQGRGGPVFDQMIGYMDSLGVDEETIELNEIRRLFEAGLRDKLGRIYNEYLQGNPGAPTHDNFERQVEKAFRHGFELYLKVFLRLDQKDAPDPHKTYTAKLGGGGTQRVADDTPVEQYLRGFITEGNDAALPRPPEEHNFIPVEGFVGYADKYQQVFEGREESALAAYMFEKIRIYADDFLKVLEASLKEGVSTDTAIEMAHYVYGTDASMYEDEVLDTLSSQEIATFAIQNRTKAKYAFDAYKQYGKTLEEQLSDQDQHPWVRSRAMIRRLIFKYPSSADIGLAIVAEQLEQLQQEEEYKKIPEEVLIDLIVANADSYREKTDEFVANANRVMGQHPATDILPLYQGEENLFELHQVEPELMFRLWRSGNRINAELNRIKKEFVSIHGELDAKAQTEGTNIPAYGRKMILKELLLKRGSESDIKERAEKRLTRQMNRGFALYEKAEREAALEDKPYAHFYVDLGYGETEKEVIENGKLITDLILEEYGRYGEQTAERYLQDLVDLYYDYLVMDLFEDKGGDLDRLRDVITMTTTETKDFYEKPFKRNDDDQAMTTLKWPDGVPERVFVPTYFED